MEGVHMESELEAIRRSVEAVVMMLWTSQEDLPDEIVGMIDEVVNEVRDIIT
tara:strand:+ start:1310 stop:1465 length:156 start_codon:yes stop_codon:yes gene_type:complete